MGEVKDKYLKRENVGYQHIGRCVSYLNQLEKEFDVAPPYFSFAHIEHDIYQIRMREGIFSWLKERVFRHENISALTQVFNFF